ncbi:MAG: DUF2191 domain-containing protein [bacterium]
MRTTLNLDNELLRQVKKIAADTDRTLTEVFQELLWQGLNQRSMPQEEFRMEWTPVRGPVKPGVDLADRDSLLDTMEKSH